MSLLIYPQPSISSTRTLSWGGIPIESQSGEIVQYRSLRSSPLHEVALQWSALSPQEWLDLDRQVRGLRGPQTQAHFYHPDWAAYPDLLAWVGDGAKTWARVPLTDIDASVLAPAVAVGGSALPSYQWGLGWENLLPSSENLGDTAKWVAVGGASITRTSGQTAPDGSPTAWRIQTSGGTLTRKLDCVGYGGTTLPSGWGRWIGCWVRNLSSTKRVGLGFMGLGASAWLNPGQGWTFLSVWLAPTGAFGVTLSFFADSASDSLDVLVWHPMALAFEPDGSDIESKEKGDAYPYLPTPTGSYIAGDLTLRRWTLSLTSAPSSGQEVRLSAYGRRLLWGRIIAQGEIRQEIPHRLSYSLTLHGREADGSET